MHWVEIGFHSYGLYIPSNIFFLGIYIYIYIFWLIYPILSYPESLTFHFYTSFNILSGSS